MEGLKKAIAAADMRAINLLVWLGLSEKLDSDLVMWAIENAGGKITHAVVNLFLDLTWRFHHDEKSKISIRLAEMRDGALRENDQRKLDTVDYIASSERPRKPLAFQFVS